MNHGSSRVHGTREQLTSLSATSLSCKAPSARSIGTSQAKPETVQKVSDIVREQLALSADTALTAESKFSALGADSLDPVEIVMALEEKFDISVEESDAQNITTIQETADLIEDLVQKKPAAQAS
ncbi:unnamed protein product [Eruca vesicaria subsp. sativa]|uniref:Acyl carrier protein n=1 Tax=Eruca vesicaria subsp. sativa TaxID=29727 RepID=A0ABC8M836_ERUVS|nr:unnamed protein product [Eruca vesicaria subsp. sativa]